MKRSALPLPRYVLRKPIKSGSWAYFFNVPIWARKAGCPVRNEPLGTEYAAAVQRAETVLLPAFDSWRTGGSTDAQVADVASGRHARLGIRRVPRRPPLHQARPEDPAQPRGRLSPRRRLRAEGWPPARRGARSPPSPPPSPMRSMRNCCRHRDRRRGQHRHPRAPHHRQPRHEDLPPRMERRGAAQSRQGALPSIRSRRWASSRPTARRRPPPSPSCRRSAPRPSRWDSVARHRRADRMGMAATRGATSSPAST